MDSQRSLRQGDTNAFFTFDEEPNKDITCPICFEPWQHPVELLPCGHIFCESCLPPLSTRCPMCRVNATKKTTPNRALTNLVASLRVSCTRCDWKGEYAQFQRHDCPAGNEHKLPPHEPRRPITIETGGTSVVSPSAPLYIAPSPSATEAQPLDAARIWMREPLLDTNHHEVTRTESGLYGSSSSSNTVTAMGREPPVGSRTDHQWSPDLDNTLASGNTRRGCSNAKKCGICCVVLTILVVVLLLVVGSLTIDDPPPPPPSIPSPSSSRPYSLLECSSVVCNSPPQHSQQCTAATAHYPGSLFECVSDHQSNKTNRCEPTATIVNCTRVCNRVTCNTNWKQCPAETCAQFGPSLPCPKHRPFYCSGGMLAGTCSDAPDIGYCTSICDVLTCSNNISSPN